MEQFVKTQHWTDTKSTRGILWRAETTRLWFGLFTRQTLALQKTERREGKWHHLLTSKLTLWKTLVATLWRSFTAIIQFMLTVSQVGEVEKLAVAQTIPLKHPAAWIVLTRLRAQIIVKPQDHLEITRPWAPLMGPTALSHHRQLL